MEKASLQKNSILEAAGIFKWQAVRCQGEELLHSLLNKTTRDTRDSLWNHFFADTKVGVKAVQTVETIVQKFNTQVEKA